MNSEFFQNWYFNKLYNDLDEVNMLIEFIQYAEKRFKEEN